MSAEHQQYFHIFIYFIYCLKMKNKEIGKSVKKIIEDMGSDTGLYGKWYINIW
jgi:hypothetical protein